MFSKRKTRRIISSLTFVEPLFFWFQWLLNHCCKKYKRASKHTDQSSRNRVVGTGKARSHLHASASLSDVDVRMCASSSTAAGHWNLSRWCLEAGGSDVRLCDDEEKPGSGPPSSTIKVDYDNQYSSCRPRIGSVAECTTTFASKCNVNIIFYKIQ